MIIREIQVQIPEIPWKRIVSLFPELFFSILIVEGWRADFHYNRRENRSTVHYIYLLFNCSCMSEWAGLGTSKIFIVPTVISWKKNFILLIFWDTAVCLHFWAKFKMAARGPKRVTSQVFWSFLLPKFFLASHSS